ncbi:BTB/POZ fold [Russula decolorans]
MSAASQDDWIRVTSRDGFSFIVKRNIVFRSGTLRNMLDERRTSLHAPPLTPILIATLPPHPLDSFTEAVQKVCPVDERAAVTEKFVEFLAYKATYENVQPNEEIPDFIERIAPEIALELLSAADYLEA